MPKKFKISPDDLEAFYKAIKGTKPLINKKVRLSPPNANYVSKNKTHESEETLLNPHEALDIQTVSSEEFIAYKQTGISHKTLRKLRKGQYNVEAMLDLHGMSVENARTAVDNFLQECLTERIRVALIIHGKGRRSQMPILKNKLNLWLREINAVLAFCSAAPAHGSRGAIYVLFKSTEEKID